jgi:hypothetical protein
MVKPRRDLRRKPTHGERADVPMRDGIEKQGLALEFPEVRLAE